MKKGTVFLFVPIFIFIVFTGCMKTLANYEPQNQDEAAIKDILINWESTWNNREIDAHLSLWNENAKIMYGKGRIIASKKEYVYILPKRMDAIPKIKIGPPTFKISNNKAELSANMKMGSDQAPVIFYLIKSGPGWSIMSWGY